MRPGDRVVFRTSVRCDVGTVVEVGVAGDLVSSILPYEADYDEPVARVEWDEGAGAQNAGDAYIYWVDDLAVVPPADLSDVRVLEDWLSR